MAKIAKAISAQRQNVNFVKDSSDASTSGEDDHDATDSDELDMLENGVESSNDEGKNFDFDVANSDSEDVDVSDDVSAEDNSESIDENPIGEDDEVYAHAHELQALSERDPEFFKYLKEEEPDLLNFDPTALDSSDEDEENKMGEKKRKNNEIAVTKDCLRELQESAFIKRSLKGLQQLIHAFKAGCYLGEEENKTIKKMAKKYSFPHGDIYNELMISCLTNAHKAFMFHMFPKQVQQALSQAEKDVKDSTSSKVSKKEKEKILQTAKELNVGKLVLGKDEFLKLQKRKQWKSLKPILISFFKSLQHMMENLQDQNLLATMLRSLQHYTIFLYPFDILRKSYLKYLVAVWTDVSKAKPTDENTDARTTESTLHILAYLRIREMTQNQPFPFAEQSLKSMYVAYAKCCTSFSERNQPSITFRGNCLVELFGVDMVNSYQAAFAFIRQLALLLRQAVSKTAKEAIGEVLKWQFLLCIRLWAAIISAYPGKDELFMLAHPLITIITGVIGLVPGLNYFPLRAHYIRILHQLAASTNVYIPTIPFILQVLESSSFSKRFKPSVDAPPALHRLLSLSSTLVETRPVQQAIVNETFRLLQEAIDLYRYNPSFPEMSIFVTNFLRKFINSNEVSKWSGMAKGIIDSCRNISKEVVHRRLTDRSLELSGLVDESIDSNFEILRKKEEATVLQRYQKSHDAYNKMIAGIIAAIDMGDNAKESKKHSRSKDSDTKNKVGSNKKRAKAESKDPIEERGKSVEEKAAPDDVGVFDPSEWK